MKNRMGNNYICDAQFADEKELLKDLEMLEVFLGNRDAPSITILRKEVMRNLKDYVAYQKNYLFNYPKGYLIHEMKECVVPLALCKDMKNN